MSNKEKLIIYWGKIFLYFTGGIILIIDILQLNKQLPLFWRNNSLIFALVILILILLLELKAYNETKK